MAGRTTEKPFKMLLGVISATNMPISSLGCFCVMYLSRRIMVGAPQESTSGGNHVSFRSKIKYPNNQSQLVWNEQFLVGVCDPTVEILSVCVKSQHMMHTPTVAACAIELKLLKLDELVDQSVALYMGQKRAGHIRLRIQLGHNEKYVGVARSVAAPVAIAKRAIPLPDAAQKVAWHQQEQAILQKKHAIQEQKERQAQQARDQELEYQRTLQEEREARMVLEQRLARQNALQQEREKRLALELELERLRNANSAGSNRDNQPRKCDNQIADLVGAFASVNMVSPDTKTEDFESKVPRVAAVAGSEPVPAFPVGGPPSYDQIFPTFDRVFSRSVTSCDSQSKQSSVDFNANDKMHSSDSSDSSTRRRRRRERKKKQAKLLMHLMKKEQKRLRRKAGHDGDSGNNSGLDSVSSASSSSTSSNERHRRKIKKKLKERRTSSTVSSSSDRRHIAEEAADRSGSRVAAYLATSNIYEDYGDKDDQQQESEAACQPTRLCSIPPSQIPPNQSSSMFSNISLADVGKVAAGAAALYNVSCGNTTSAAGLIPIGRAIGKMLSGNAHHRQAIVNANAQDDSQQQQFDDSSTTYDTGTGTADAGTDWASYGGDY